MITVKQYSEDPTNYDAMFITQGEFERSNEAKKIAAKRSKKETGYFAVYDELGEQIAGFQDGKQVQ